MKIEPDPLALARIQTAQAILESLGPIVKAHGEDEALAALLTATAVASHQIGVAKGAVSALRKMVPLVAAAAERVGPDATSLDLLVELYTR